VFLPLKDPRQQLQLLNQALAANRGIVVEALLVARHLEE
jgi:hypothetical protein